MTIKDVAARSGFSAPTLRYYEEIGLLPEATRTRSGYRTYDERALDRLAFIARAKQLGCTLEEISALTTAWDGGRCGPVQDQLRTVVTAKLAAAQAQIVELTTLLTDLRRAAASLEQHRPDGPCDERCGCVADRGTAPSPAAVSLSTKPTPADAPGSPGAPIACTLTPDALRGQLDDWQTLLSHATSRSRVDGGVRLELNTDTPVTQLALLVAAEQDCCQFLRFAITVDGRGVGLEVSGPSDALPIVESLFGVPA